MLLLVEFALARLKKLSPQRNILDVRFVQDPPYFVSLPISTYEISIDILINSLSASSLIFFLLVHY